MYGAVIGDIIGSPYEFNNLPIQYSNYCPKEFDLRNSNFTDDTVLTVAIADACLKIKCSDTILTNDEIKNIFSKKLYEYGNTYNYFGNCLGYGLSFLKWLSLSNHIPYNSCGNGSAMRVSSIGWLFDDLDVVRKMAKFSAEVTHNHPEGIKGAECIASIIFKLRNGDTKEQIKEYVEREFGYDLDKDPYTFNHSELCQDAVPQAIIIFLNNKTFIDSIEECIKVRGDTDTIGAICGSICEAYYGKLEIESKIKEKLPLEFIEILDKI